MTCALKNVIPDQEVAGVLKPIRTSAPFTNVKDRNFRNINDDIQTFNEIAKNGKTVSDILAMSSVFLHRPFGYLKIQEIFIRRRPGEKPELIAKCGCSCGNDIFTPLRALADGNLINCGCRTPLPKQYARNIAVFQSESPTRWTTTVDGIQWFGNRYMWFVTLFVRGICVLREYTPDSREALRIRKEAELKYYGQSEVSRYESMMLYELEQFRLTYLAKRPPKVEGIYYNTGEKVWNARLWHDRNLVFDKTFKTREEAVKARLRAERKFYGAPIMAEQYYV